MEGVFWFVLCIIAITTVGRLLRQHMQLKAGQAKTEPAQQARFDALEQRVQTLERIVTDKGYDLKREFDKL